MHTSEKPIRLFISYAHEDESFLVQFEKHLSSLKREKLLTTWYDRKILPGDKWEDEIDNALKDSDIAVFLVSPDFVSSEYCQGKELALALDKHGRGELIVVPLVIRPVDWLSTPLGKLQGVPIDGKAISTWEDRDLAWLDCVQRIRLLVRNLITSREVDGKKDKGIQRFVLQEALVSVIEELDVRYNSDTDIGGVPTGLHDLDRLIDGLHNGDLITVASNNWTDCANLLFNITGYVVADAGLPAIIFSLRHTKEDVCRKLLGICAHISPYALQRGMILDEEWPSLTQAIQKLNDAPMVLFDEPEVHIEAIEYEVKRFSSDAGKCALVVIDSIENIIGASRNEIIKRLSRLARTIKTSIVIGAELEQDPSHRAIKRPIIGDLGQIVQSLDFVIFVYRDDLYNPDSPDRGTAEIIVARNNRGPIGTVRVNHLSGLGKFLNYSGSPKHE